MNRQSSDSSASDLVSTVQRVLERRIANPALRWLLRSRLHWLASHRLLLVSYEGRHSGTQYTFPVVYSRQNGDFVVVTPPDETTWWKNFVEPRRCAISVRGKMRPATGTVVTGDDRDALLVAHLESSPALRWLFGFGRGSLADPAQFSRAKELFTVVLFRVGTMTSASAAGRSVQREHLSTRPSRRPSDSGTSDTHNRSVSSASR
ncbi:nitroreductase/quinone reductase family protein [Natronococcus pandeyae]